MFLVQIILQKPSVSISGKTATLLGTPLSNNATANGTAALACLCDSAGNVIESGITVGLVGSGANIEIGSVSISIGETVTIVT